MLGGAWLQQIHDDHPPFPYHAISFWGVDGEGHLLVTIHDSGTVKRERFVYPKNATGSFSFQYQGSDGILRVEDG